VNPKEIVMAALAILGVTIAFALGRGFVKK
jgi:hypothetical protein